MNGSPSVAVSCPYVWAKPVGFCLPACTFAIDANPLGFEPESLLPPPSGTLDSDFACGPFWDPAFFGVASSGRKRIHFGVAGAREGSWRGARGPGRVQGTCRPEEKYKIGDGTRSGGENPPKPPKAQIAKQRKNTNEGGQREWLASGRFCAPGEDLPTLLATRKI